jgi:hypothetical protein
MMTHARLCIATLALAAAETLFWFYTFHYIGSHANPMGDGMEWLAEVPITIIFLALVAPALVLGVFGWWSARAAKIAAGLALLAFVSDLVVWAELTREFAHKAAH